ncbi:hypothetical protein ACP4OV_021404 [Aristida adscensionis]
METSVIVLSIVVGLFAVASAVVGFIAEANRLTPDDIQFSDGVCVYPAKPAFVLGICAVALLLVAQIIGTVAGCFGCCKPQATDAAPESRRWVKKAISTYVLSWIAAGMAVGSYLYGVSWNAATTRGAVTLVWDAYCHYLKGGVFRRGALLSLAAGVLAISSYAMLRSPRAAPGAELKPDGQQPGTAGVAVGEAQNTHQFAHPPQGRAQAQV